MTSSDIVIFANPIAGRGAGRTIALRVEAGLRAAGFSPQLWLRRASEWAPPSLAGLRAAVVIGGDGTLRSVAHHLYHLADPPKPGTAAASQPVEEAALPPPMLVIPLGTANLMCRHLGLKWDHRRLERQVADAIRYGRVTEIDAASANGQTFLLMVGVGFDAAVVHELSRVRRGPINYASYLLPAARTAGSYPFPPLILEADGRRVFGPAPGVVFVGNVPEYGTGFPMLPHAEPGDGLLDVCAMPCSNLVEAAALLLRAAAGEHPREEGVVYLKAKQVRIDAPAAPPPGVPVQIDGDAAGHTPVEIHLLPRRLRLIVR